LATLDKACANERFIAHVSASTPCCGLWRFEHGLIAEHWENAYDVHTLVSALTG
jgi:hypothetical protein